VKRKSSAGFTCCCLLLALVSKIGDTGGGVLHGVTPCFLLSTAQFTAQLLKSGKFELENLMLSGVI
jgi:hypothetical protein